MIADATGDATTIGVIADTTPGATAGGVPGPIRGVPVARAPMRPRA